MSTKKERTAKPLPDSDEALNDYPEHLKFLWEQYNRLIGIGLFASATTVAFLLQAVVFNRELYDLQQARGVSLDQAWLAASMICCGAAALLFIGARWCSQVMMERQVYGRLAVAQRYFAEVLEDDTLWPTALREKPYLRLVQRRTILRGVSWANELLGIFAVLLVVIGWACGLKFAWPLILVGPIVPCAG